MALNVNSRILLGVSTVAALVAGAGTAVLASGAGPSPRVITLVAGPERIVTIKGSAAQDSISIAGAAPNSITIDANRTISNMRTDCDVSPSGTSAFCSSGMDGGTVGETIETPLGAGADKLSFSEFFDGDNEAVRMIAKGAAGADVLDGSRVPDRFDGGAGDDVLRGHDGNDDLDGGANRDSCKGGPGHDHVRHCE